MPRDVGVVVVAAGRGARLGGEAPKQYRPIGGVPMVLRALRPFATHPEVARIVLVLPAEDAAAPPEFLRELESDGLVIVAGGAERTDSVGAGLAALGAECTTVLVHDAARPFVERTVIDAVIAHARAGEGAVAAVPVSDTLKEASGEDPSRVERTVPRTGLWRAQTPQGFPRAVLERAHAQFAAGGPDGRSTALTDDAALVERSGVAVRLVLDSPRNFKVTTLEDLAFAELLARREG
ncbi:MAG TPA: 2-C-methyl-D-erythritol 4-phosphate cytidylyltransferase [Gemmatimonadales bacterium]|nr:2-C-methyl-D-erythritol 4-phosphate cytidylyltransferase [Gemmatimonadales bacterium]